MKWIKSLFLVALLFFCGCMPPVPPLTRYRISLAGTLDTVVTLTAYCSSAAVFDRAAKHLEQELKRLDAIFNVYSPSSALAHINAGTEIAAPPELLSLLSYTTAQQTVVDGFHVGMGAVLRLWHTARAEQCPPSPAAIADAMNHCSMLNVTTVNKSICISDRQMALDFGGVAKGYVADRLAQLLPTWGIRIFLLDCGTSTLVCRGIPPGKAGWKIDVQHPNRRQLLGTLLLKEKSFGISGDTQKYFVHNGTYYSHIIDQTTGYPAAYYRLVCVLADTGAQSDFLSTALFALPFEQARQQADRLPGVEVLWMFADGHIRTTDHFPLGGFLK